MATSEQNPSPALLRLRPADVVRFCGLNAAAAGLELAANHEVIAGQREGSRLFATMNTMPPHVVEVEVADEAESARWSCDCAQNGPLACEHVAATLSAWITHPSDFHARGGGQSPVDDVKMPQASSDPPAIFAPPRLQNRPMPVAETTLAVALSRMSAADVALLARRIPGTDVPEHPDETRRRLLATLSAPAQIEALLDRLDTSARALLALLELAGGAITSADLEGFAQRVGEPLSAVQSNVAVLERHALLVPMLPSSAPSEHGHGSSWRHVAGWRIPDEVRRALPMTLPLETLPTPTGSRFAPSSRAGASTPRTVASATPRSLCLALALLADAPPPLGLPRKPSGSSEPHPPARSGAGELAGALTRGEIAPERLRELARAAGLEEGAVRLARRMLRLARERQAPDPITNLARVPVAERPIVLRAAFRQWLRADSAADLVDVESAGGRLRVRYATAHPGFSPAAIAQEVREARRFVARLLSHTRPDEWYAFDDFAALVWQVRPGFLRGQQRAWATPAWWLESAVEQRPLHPDDHDDWRAGEGAFLHALLAGALFTWGAVDLATGVDGAVVAFRVTPFGAFLLRRENTPVDAALVAVCDTDWGPPVLPLRDGALAVQPLSASSRLLDALALWAEPTAISGRRIVYFLSADRACAAFDQHLSPDALPAILRPLHSRAADLAAARLGQWRADWGKSRITAGFTLLEASDEAALVEALAVAPGIAARCRRIAPTLALALPEDAAALRTLLTRRGYAV